MSINREKNIFTYKLYAFLFGYDEKKYWKRRQIVVDKNNKKYSNDEFGVLFNKDKKLKILYQLQRWHWLQ